jgi:flagellar biosynthesis protein FlhF
MKITRHTAPDMRQALRAVRDRLGGEAVILATKRTANGVEITAAMDFDANQVQETAAPATNAIATTPAAAAIDAAPLPAAIEAVTEPAPAGNLIPTLNPASDVMSLELKTLRRMLETQVAHLAWKDLSQRAPVQTALLRELTEIGLEQGLAAEIVAEVPHHCELDEARRQIGVSLSQRLPTSSQWLEDGGRIALVGPTGVGKTTILAKLAVRWVLRHGPHDLALIAGDSVRIGALDQVRALGQLLGVPVFALDRPEELPAVLARLERFRMVLVDTPGAGQRDVSLAQRLLQLSKAGGDLHTTLVLAASTQPGALEEVVRRFAPAQPSSCVLTKVDEAVTLGGLLSVLVRARLPIAYVSEGQRVPEDLRPARSLDLIAAAVHLARTNGAAADEDLLKRRFGDVAHALA